MIVGADIGRSYVKVATGAKPENVLVYPSYVRDGKELNLQNALNDNDMLSNLVVTINGNTYFVGELAQREGGSREFQKHKALHRNTPIHLITSVAYQAKNKVVMPQLVVGLPITDYQAQASEFKESIAGSSYKVELPHKSVQVVFSEEVIAFPEGAGAVWNMMLGGNGQPVNTDMMKQTIAVVDIGWKTVNYLLLEEMQYNNDRSGTLLEGLSRGFNQFEQRIKRDYDITSEQAEKLFLKQGQAEMRQQAQRIQDKLSEKWPGMTLYDKIYLCGGGARALGAYLDLPKAQVVEHPQLANALGFWKVATAHYAQKKG